MSHIVEAELDGDFFHPASLGEEHGRFDKPEFSQPILGSSAEIVPKVSFQMAQGNLVQLRQILGPVTGLFRQKYPVVDAIQITLHSAASTDNTSGYLAAPN